MAGIYSGNLALVSVFGLFTLCAILYDMKPAEDDSSATATPGCSIEMFEGDVNAYRACLTAYALQHNWYPSPIAGLYKYQAWNGFDGFWQNGNVLETLANYMYYGNNTMYKSVLVGSLRNLTTLIQAYAPQPSYDDMAWYAISYMRIHEVIFGGASNYTKFLDAARDIYQWIWDNGWDSTGKCGGGFWFDQGENAKRTIENIQMLFIGGKLFRLTQDQSLIERINDTWNFLAENNSTNMETYLVADALNDTKCGNNGMYGPSYNMGIMIGGLLEAGPALNRTTEFVRLAQNMAEASNKFISSSGVITEYCTPNCDDDEKMFKGIYLRNLRYLIDFMESHKEYHDDKKVRYYRSFMQHNSDTAWVYNRCEPSGYKYCDVIYKDGPSLSKGTVGPVFGTDFGGPFDISAPMQQTAALDLFVSSIQSGARCRGRGCKFDPPVPHPKPLTCDVNPCPDLEQCCATVDSYTCCDSGQTCTNGVCQ